MAENNRKKARIDTELAEKIEKMMAEAEAAERITESATEEPETIKDTGSEEVESKELEVKEVEVQEVEVQEGKVKEVGSEEVEVKEITEKPSRSSDDVVPKESVNETEDPDQKKDKTGKALKIILLTIGILLVLLIIGVVATYAYEAKRYEDVFFGNTYINNIDVSYRTPEDVKAEIKELCKDYEITVKSRYRDDETIKASDVGMQYLTGDEIDNILSAQEPMRFYFEKDEKKEYEIPTMLKVDKDMVAKVCGSLESFNDDTVTDPVDAYLGDYDPDLSEYVIVPDKDGNRITDKNKAVSYIYDAIITLDPEVDLEDIAESIYPVAEIRSDNEALIFEKKNLDKFVKTKITYKDSDIVLDGSTIKGWIITDELGNTTIDEEKIRSFVEDLAGKLDTIGTERKFTSWYGNDTSVSGGTFGWEVDQEAEIAQLKVEIPESTVTEREPVYSKRGVTHGDNDWGDTYVEVNLAKQHLFFVKEGKLVVETDVVSGGLQRKAGTPTGVYSINYKSRNAVLRGPRRADGTYQWESPVSYWMPFNKGIGLHDATWRGSFGGTIYKYNGSHGCVNLPKKNAKIIFENIEAGTPVIVYDDDFVIIEKENELEAESETETETETKAKKKTQAATQPATQAATQPETQPAAEAATQPETQPASETETSVEIGPGTSGSTTEAEYGPAFQNQTEAEITYNAENLPGEMQ